MAKNKDQKLIGMWGYPNPSLFKEIKEKYPSHKIIDLDVNYNNPPSGLLPEASCRIIRNIADNTISMKNSLEIIIASVGKEKCDAGWFLAKILSREGFNVIETVYEHYNFHETQPIPISTGKLPLKTKIMTIMDNLIEKAELKIEKCEPTFGFWGVPPNDLSILEVFPDTTHVYGWTRCTEAGRPADIELEMFVDEGIPVVFFAQTFCAKTHLAKYLAKKHGGIYVDVDDTATNSVRAKIEAFIKLG